MPAATTDWLVGSFRQPNAALLATIGPQICAFPGPLRDPRNPQWFAAAWARRLQLPIDLPHQVSYSQHVTSQISWRLASTQRDRLPSLGRGHRSRIKEAAVWLVGQCSIFVRNREQLANPPVSLALDGAAIERLTRLVSAWALAGLAAAA